MPSLADLIAPLDADTFEARFWDQEPFCLERPAPGRTQGLMHFDSASGKPAFGPALQPLMRAIAGTLQAEVGAQGALADASEDAALPRYAQHSSFLVVVGGRIEARVWAPMLHWPLPSEPCPEAGVPGVMIALEATLGTGSLLYIPRGFPHTVRPLQDRTLMLMIYAAPRTWWALLGAALDAWADPRLEEPVPQPLTEDAEDHFEDLLDDFAEQVRVDTAAAAMGREPAPRPQPPYTWRHVLRACWASFRDPLARPALRAPQAEDALHLEELVDRFLEHADAEEGLETLSSWASQRSEE
ncbi:MAG: hypothetical protein H6739_09415 [Alphaproteobacteria bacterium]|nr:hypothetical protein [Alphaproteobacteria bacterium]